MTGKAKTAAKYAGPVDQVIGEMQDLPGRAQFDTDDVESSARISGGVIKRDV